MLAMLKFVVVELAAATDAELVKAIAQASDVEAEGELCRRMAPRLRLYGLRHLRNEQAAADLMQQVLIVMIESLRAGRLREPEKLASFVLGTCRMTVLDIRRGARRREGLLEEYARGLEKFEMPGEALDVAQLSACLQRLAAREQSVIVLTFYEERAGSEVAASLGMTAENARVVRHRALAKLRSCMEAA
jgi:RNA polymerase sigma-70 factor (ECF subfamily)